MSIEAIKWVLQDAPDLPPQCFAVLLSLANHSDPNGRASFPSQRRLAWYARKKVRAVQRDLAQLEESGLIRRGNQKRVAWMPVDRRPVVWDLALELRQPVPEWLAKDTDPESGRSLLHGPVDNRDVVRDGPVGDRGVVQDRPGCRTGPTGTSYTTYKPSINHQERKGYARSLRGGVPKQERCPLHEYELAHNCGPCAGTKKGLRD